MPNRDYILHHWFIGGLILLNLALITFLIAGRNAPRHPARPADTIRLWKKELKLSDGQVADFERIMEEHRRQTEPLHRAQLDNRQALLLAAQSVEMTDTTLIAHLTAESAALHRQLDEGLVRHYQALLATCTPAQQERMSQIFLKTLRPPGRPPSHR